MLLTPLLTSVEPLDGYQLRLAYSTGETGIFDVTPYISGSWFGMLAEPGYFATVHLIDGGHGIEWADGQDIAPHELYDHSVGDMAAV
jgi:hypothetical protein